MTKSFTRSISVGGDAKGIGGSVDISQSEKRSRMDSQSMSCSVKSKWQAAWWLSLDKPNAKLSPELTRFILEMDPEDDNAYVELFEVFGTHYALSTLFGAYASEVSYFEATETASKISKSNSVSAKVKGGKGGKGDSGGGNGGGGGGGGGGSGEVGISTEFATEGSSSTRREQGRNELYGMGGSGGNFDSFTMGNPEDFVPLRVDLRPIDEVLWPELSKQPLSPSEKQHFDRVRQNAKEQLERYLRTNQPVEFTAPDPIVLEVSIEKVECIEVKDAFNGLGADYEPDIYGKINIVLDAYSDEVDMDSMPTLNTRDISVLLSNAQKRVEWESSNKEPIRSIVHEACAIDSNENQSLGVGDVLPLKSQHVRWVLVPKIGPAGDDGKPMVDRFLNSNIRFQTNLIDGDQAGEDQLNNGARFELSVSECMSAFEEEEKR